MRLTINEFIQQIREIKDIKSVNDFKKRYKINELQFYIICDDLNDELQFNISAKNWAQECFQHNREPNDKRWSFNIYNNACRRINEIWTYWFNLVGNLIQRVEIIEKQNTKN